MKCPGKRMVSCMETTFILSIVLQYVLPYNVHHDQRNHRFRIGSTIFSNKSSGIEVGLSSRPSTSLLHLFHENLSQHYHDQHTQRRNQHHYATTQEQNQEQSNYSIQQEQTQEGESDTDKFHPLFEQTYKTTKPRAADETKNAHDPFRFEWGTWIDDDAILQLMENVDQVRASTGAYDKLMPPPPSTNDNINKRQQPKRYLLASGEKWDCILHALPSNLQYHGRWPTGSWTIIKALTGVVEVAMLKEDRDGNLSKRTTKDLRGGSDGSFGLASGAGAGANGAIGGEDCIKYVGGPLRSYMGKSDRTILLEVVVRPPISVEDENQVIEEWPRERLNEVIDIFVPPEPSPEDDDMEDDEKVAVDVQEDISGQEQVQNLGNKLGMNFENVGGLDKQLDTIVRRVLASRANPEAARRLGISHVRGILLSGPPGCGKTLLARELATLLGAREPQIVNGPEILDKFIGEAEKRVRDLFVPAELEYAQVGDDSALHIIILDEMDAIARKRGSASSDTTGVRDSVVNQLLAKIDGVKNGNNFLVLGLTNRPELIDPALLRPGRLEVQLRVELPDLKGRRDIFRIHTRKMQETGAVSETAVKYIENLGESGLPALTDKFTGAEAAGLVRSAASFALARSVSTLEEGQNADMSFLDSEEGKVSVADFNKALKEVRPSLGKQEDVLRMRFPRGISLCSMSMERITRDLERFIAPVKSTSPRLNSMLLVGAGGNGGTGVSALGAWAASEASSNDIADYVRFVTTIDLLSCGDGSGRDGSRAAALIEQFSEAREMAHSLLVLDDIDQLCAGAGNGGYSSVMIATLRALLRTPPESSTTAKAGGQSTTKNTNGRSIHIIATTSRSDAACSILHELFDETIVVPLLTEVEEVHKLLLDGGYGEHSDKMAKLILDKMGNVGVKTVLRLAERSSAMVASNRDNISSTQNLELKVLEDMLNDLQGDNSLTSTLCNAI